MISSNVGHLGDHVTDRGRIADEVVVLRADLAMQPDEVEPLVVENRPDRSVGFVAVEPESRRDPVTDTGDGQNRRVEIRHPDDDILRPFRDNGSQQLDLLNGTGDDPTNP